MAKQSVSIKGTSVSDGKAVGNHVEQTVYVEDSLLPSPSELRAYKEIDPKIVEFLISSSTKEQEHRHRMDAERMKVMRYSEHKNGRMNWWGMWVCNLNCVKACSSLSVSLSAGACPRREGDFGC